MLERARAKAARPAGRCASRPPTRSRCPFADDAFDAATVAFGIRNVDDLDRALAEMARVVRPGGRVVILEITTPARMRRFYELWFDRVVPRLGRLLGRDGAAYAYLPASVRRFPEPPELAARMAAAGLARRALAAARRSGSWRSTTGASRDVGRPPAVAAQGRRAHARPLRGAPARAPSPATRPRSARPAADTLTAGGKRVRPLLVFCAAPRVAPARSGPAQDGLLSAAVAVELVHMATLVHDDLLDGATMRRGRPTVAESLGAGARRSAPATSCSPAPSRELTRTGSPRAVQALAAAALDLSQGEIDQQRAAFDLGLSEEAYLARCRRKTAALFSVACRLGALMGGASPEAEERLAAFGENVGMAFQIFDDILDLAGAPEATGKRRGTDLCDGTVTLPVILAMQLEPGLRARRGRRLPGTRAGGAVRPPRRAPGRAARARAGARRSWRPPAASIEDGLQDEADVEALLEIADGVVDRYS